MMLEDGKPGSKKVKIVGKPSDMNLLFSCLFGWWGSYQLQSSIDDFEIIWIKVEKWLKIETAVNFFFFGAKVIYIVFNKMKVHVRNVIDVY